MTPRQTPVGRVTLVGAGPGDPELITLKAVKALREATVVLLDDLVNEAVLEHCTPGVRVIPVGKRGGCQSTPQAFIGRLMVQAAQAGERVVRLKGGDPFIFGRGGEEVETLRDAGIAVDVISGVTSASAAMAALGTPLTHRQHAHGVVFVTGHARPGAQGTDWAALAQMARQAHLTLVIYMGVSQIDEIEAGLLQGLGADTPAAVVEQASLPQQREQLCTLGTLALSLRQHGLRSPAIIVVGDVLRGLAASRAPYIADEPAAAALPAEARDQAIRTIPSRLARQR